MNIFKNKHSPSPAADRAAELRLNMIVSRFKDDRPPISAPEVPAAEAIQRRFWTPEELQAAGVG